MRRETGPARTTEKLSQMTDAHEPSPSSRGGQAPFVPDRVDADPASMTATWIDALRSREMTRYRRALTLPAQPNVKAAVLDDMEAYWGLEISAWFGNRAFSVSGGESNEDPTIATMAGAPVGSPEAQASALLWRDPSTNSASGLTWRAVEFNIELPSLALPSLLSVPLRWDKGLPSGAAARSYTGNYLTDLPGRPP